jgi:hypothetical protein
MRESPEYGKTIEVFHARGRDRCGAAREMFVEWFRRETPAVSSKERNYA